LCRAGTCSCWSQCIYNQPKSSGHSRGEESDHRRGCDGNKCGVPLVEALGTTHIDVLINNAGYFYGPVETLSSLNFEEEIKMIDICAVGPLRVTAALFNAGLLSQDAKVEFCVMDFAYI